jgi:hypothetical protein
MKVTVLYCQNNESDNISAKIIIPAKSHFNILENVFGFILKGRKLSIPKDYYISIEVITPKYLRKKGVIDIFLDYIQNGVYSDKLLYTELTEEPPELPKEGILKTDTIEVEDSLINDTLRANSLTEKELDKKLSKL